MKIPIPELSLIALVGISGSGKSTFAQEHFLPTEVLSSDSFRGLVSDDENNQEATADAFDSLYYIAAKRLARGRLTVIDATNIHPQDRKKIIEMARGHDVLPIAIVLNTPLRICAERNNNRQDRNFGFQVLRRQHSALKKSLRGLKREGFNRIFVLNEEQVANAGITRQKLWNDRRDEHGPFDIIGDVHGCFSELIALLKKLGYAVEQSNLQTAGGKPHYRVTPPDGRKAVFLGDLVDRGPDSPGVLRLVMDMVAADNAICVPGNHDEKLKRKLQGRNVRVAHGLAETLSQLDSEPDSFKEVAAEFLAGLISHYVLDDGNLVVAHAGMKQAYQGRASGRVRAFALYGETTGETDEFGLPVRYPWAEDYRGQAVVVYGHTPIPEPEWRNRTINIDTGCVFGGSLTALRYPERELVSVPAARTYSQPVRPLARESEAGASDLTQRPPDVLDLQDVYGKRVVNTRLRRNITLRENQTAAALEVMSRFAADPHWLIYLPPTMSPPKTSSEPNLLEHPREAFDYFRKNGVTQVVCQEKHMGSRAVVVVCQSPESARRRFGVVAEESGIIYTRTGRRFFSDADQEKACLERIHRALEQAGWWDRFESDWFAFDCELMPWSAKAQKLLEEQYAAVGDAAERGFERAVQLLETAVEIGADAGALLERYRQRAARTAGYRQAYRQYCWPVQNLTDLKLAPFHLLASEGRTYFDRTHTWHMQTLRELCEADPEFLFATENRPIDLTDEASTRAGVGWWEEMTGRGGEGMVVKPLDFITEGPKGLVQPAVKCRGREYLRIIYGPEYTALEHLNRLKNRGLGKKRSLALREFALGVEGLERFVRKQPLYAVHECVFGVLALESDPVDPRL